MGAALSHILYRRERTIRTRPSAFAGHRPLNHKQPQGLKRRPPKELPPFLPTERSAELLERLMGRVGTPERPEG
jgi:hypothetical protein